MSNANSLDKLLTINDMHSLYVSLGISKRTDIDIENTPYDLPAARNSIALLISVGLVGTRFGRYNRKDKSQYIELANFKSELITRIYKQYASQIKYIFGNIIYYDEELSQYYLKRNSIDLNLSGLLMLLSGLGAVSTTRTNVFINDNLLLANHKNPALHDEQISITKLKAGLAIKDALGMEAERIALRFEKTLLTERGINGEPSIISDVDVSAGYDIVSFMDNQSLIPNKFIEVKSCADYQYRFYMSKNEADTARDKGNSYFLYLYNRTSKQFRIVQNPFEKVFDNDEWAKEPQIFEIHSIN